MLQRANQLRERILIVHGHQLRAQSVIGRVERQRQPKRYLKIRESFNAGDNARGRDRDVSCAEVSHVLVIEGTNCREDVGFVQKRLAHSHEDDVVDVGSVELLHHEELSKDLAACQVPREAVRASLTEHAAQRTARLTRYTSRLVSAVVEQHGLDLIAVGEEPKKFLRAVLRGLLLHQDRQGHQHALGELGSNVLR